jgi:alkylhydroperoxidase/carboxymuconolactone decarboxylase family protein YurZ
MAAPITPVLEILDRADVEALRSGYQASPAAVANFAEGKYAALYPPGKQIFNTFVDTFFTHGDPAAPPLVKLSARDRELSIIAMMAARSEVLTLAIHFYWAVGEGVDVASIAETLLLVGGYAGLDCYGSGLEVHSKTLTALKGAPRDQGAVMPAAALQAVAAAFA